MPVPRYAMPLTMMPALPPKDAPPLARLGETPVAPVPQPLNSGGTTDFRNDIIFSTGSFIQFPDGTMT